jgi:hypothetical protein
MGVLSVARMACSIGATPQPERWSNSGQRPRRSQGGRALAGAPGARQTGISPALRLASAVSDSVRVARDQGIATVTLNRPASLNALTRGMWAALGAASGTTRLTRPLASAGRRGFRHRTAHRGGGAARPSRAQEIRAPSGRSRTARPGRIPGALRRGRNRGLPRGHARVPRKARARSQGPPAGRPRTNAPPPTWRRVRG